MKHRHTISLACLGMMTTASLQAAVIGVWGFNDTSSQAVALSASSVAAGVTVSGLAFNDSFDFAGLSNAPNSVHDGYGFGDNGGAAVVFVHRANYFDGSAVPPKENASDYTSWGNGGTDGTGDNLSANGNAPVVFTVSADAGQTITLESLTFDLHSGADTIVQFQAAGAAVGSSVTLTSNGDFVVALNDPVVIASGQSKSFTFNLNSGSLNSSIMLDDITLNGTVVPEPSSTALLGLGGLALILRRRR